MEWNFSFLEWVKEKGDWMELFVLPAPFSSADKPRWVGYRFGLSIKLLSISPFLSALLSFIVELFFIYSISFIVKVKKIDLFIHSLIKGGRKREQRSGWLDWKLITLYSVIKNLWFLWRRQSTSTFLLHFLPHKMKKNLKKWKHEEINANKAWYDS